MFQDEIRRAIEAVPRLRLPEVAAAMYGAFTEGRISEVELEALAALIEARKSIPAPSLRKSVGSRSRSPEWIERRRRHGGSGALPPNLREKFTQGERAVLTVISVEVAKSGRCDLPIKRIGDLAGVGPTTVRNAIREAQRLGLVAVEIRRVAMWRNLPNVITIVSPDWLAWSRMGGGGAFNSARGLYSPMKKKGGLAAEKMVFEMAKGTNQVSERASGGGCRRR
ncbi:transcriptional regulator [Methylobacterium sp. CM6247]